MDTPSAHRHLRKQEAISRWAHFAPTAFVLLVGAYVASDVLRSRIWLLLLILVPLFVILTIAIFCHFTHESQLCVRCAKATPLTPGELGPIVRRLLWTAHHHLRVPILGIMISLAVNLLAGSHPSLLPLAQVCGYAVPLTLAWTTQAQLTHRVHRPWCRWCRGWEDGGDVEETPSPKPPSKTLQLT